MKAYIEVDQNDAWLLLLLMSRAVTEAEIANAECATEDLGPQIAAVIDQTGFVTTAMSEFGTEKVRSLLAKVWVSARGFEGIRQHALKAGFDV